MPWYDIYMNMKLKLALTTPLIVLPFIAQAETPPISQYYAIIADMKTIQKKLSTTSEEAKTDRDSIKYVCINDRLRLIGGTIEQALIRKEPLETSIATGDVEGINHNILIVQELHRRAETAAAEADLCLGAEIVRNSEEQLKYEVDDNIATPNLDPPTPSMVVEPPACASCYR